MQQCAYDLTVEFVWIVFEQFLETIPCLLGADVLSAEDADGAAQGERWCMQQIVVPAAFLATEADNPDGFRLKPPQNSLPPHS